MASVESPVPKEYVDLFNKGIYSLTEQLKDTHLTEIESLALQISYSFENKIFTLPDDDAGHFLSIMLTKLINELYGIVGCLKNGSYIGSISHIRSIIELYGYVGYVFTDKDKSNLRLASVRPKTT